MSDTSKDLDSEKESFSDLHKKSVNDYKKYYAGKVPKNPVPLERDRSIQEFVDIYKSRN
jgi:hypothetical protein